MLRWLMSERNSPCPCGSGKKYKQCCFVLIGKTNTLAAFDKIEQGVVNLLAESAQKIFAEIKDDHGNEVKKFRLDEVQLVTCLLIDLWNMSFLSTLRIKQVLARIENNAFREFSKDIVYYRFNSPLIVVYWLSVDITDFYTKCFIFKMVTFIPQGGYLPPPIVPP